MNEKVLRVEIKQAFGLTPAEAGEKKHNIWIGISMSNRKFTPENIEALILWALENTKEKVLVWIPGRMQTTNYHYFDKMDRSKALKKAFDEEDRFKKIVQDILNNLPEVKRNRVTIANFDDTHTPKYIRHQEIFYREFAEQGDFYESIMRIVEDMITARGRTIEKGRAESLSVYVLQELPMFLDGIQTLYSDDLYTLIPYPGSGKLDELEVDIIDGKRFPELTKKLKLENKVGILDVEFV